MCRAVGAGSGANWESRVKFANQVAIVGIVLTVGASASGLISQGPNLDMVNAAGWAQVVALLLLVIGVVRGSRWWLLSLLLVLAGGFLWLLEQGH